MSNHIDLADMSISTPTPLRPPLVGHGAQLAARAPGGKASAVLALLTWALVACGGGGDGASPAPPQAPASSPTSTAPPPAANPTAPPPSAAGDTSTSVAVTGPLDRAAALDLFSRVIEPAFALPFNWTGTTNGCVASDTSADYKAAVLRTVNAYRAMAGLPGNLTLNLETSRLAQSAALMMQANRRLDHFPTADWACYSADGARAAGSSNLALGASGPKAMQLYVADNGVPGLGHRRWLLATKLSELGTGDTANANALWVFGLNAAVPPQAASSGVAWPPKGFVPWSNKVASPLETWSFSLPGAEFSRAVASMSNDQGQALTVTNLGELQRNFGDNTLAWTLTSASASWSRSPADTKLTVKISNVMVDGVTRSFEYDVVFFLP